MMVAVAVTGLLAAGLLCKFWFGFASGADAAPGVPMESTFAPVVVKTVGCIGFSTVLEDWFS